MKFCEIWKIPKLLVRILKFDLERLWLKCFGHVFGSHHLSVLWLRTHVNFCPEAKQPLDLVDSILAIHNFLIVLICWPYKYSLTHLSCQYCNPILGQIVPTSRAFSSNLCHDQMNPLPRSHANIKIGISLPFLSQLLVISHFSLSEFLKQFPLSFSLCEFQQSLWKNLTNAAHQLISWYNISDNSLSVLAPVPTHRFKKGFLMRWSFILLQLPTISLF